MADYSMERMWAGQNWKKPKSQHKQKPAEKVTPIRQVKPKPRKEDRMRGVREAAEILQAELGGGFSRSKIDGYIRRSDTGPREWNQGVQWSRIDGLYKINVDAVIRWAWEQFGGG